MLRFRFDSHSDFRPPRATGVPRSTRVCVAALSSVALALSVASCGEGSQGAGTNSAAESAAPQQAPEPNLLGAQEWLPAFFPQTKKVVVAAPEMLGQAAAYAVDKQLPLIAAGTALPEGAEEINFADLATQDSSVGQLPALDVAGIAARRPDADGSRTVFVTSATSLADAATAAAAGARLLVLPTADPRATHESMQALDPASGTEVVVPAAEFGPADRFAAALTMAKAGELPGGGGLLFPGRRMVALYGHPSGPALGALGEQDPAAAVARVQELAAQYKAVDGENVIPAFEIIATVASGGPGPDGDFSNESDPAELKPYIDAIVNAGGYAFLDLQPGRASLLEQAKRYESLLKHPQVGLALDPEWKLGPDQLPMTDIGHVEAAEVNEVSDWLAALTRDNGLPQKGLIIHQFQLQMLRDREKIRMDRPELATIIHVDGHGSTGVKFGTWDVMRQDLNPAAFLAWKNFIDEDTPMFTPEQTLAVNPRPWFVSYQ